MSESVSRRRWLWVAASCFAGPGLQAADWLPAAEVARVRAVIQAQLDAFAANDAERAFSYAAPRLRQMFGTSERFMAMVRSGYPAVVRPTSVAFFEPEQRQGNVVQRVQMTDGRGVVWMAVYQMERQPDGAWRIAGCQIKEGTARVA